MKGDSIQIQPNPANDYIDVTIIEIENFNSNNELTIAESIEDAVKPIVDKGYTYFILDNHGRSLFQKKTSEKYIRINTSDFNEGIYHIKVISSKGISGKQFIISH